MLERQIGRFEKSAAEEQRLAATAATREKAWAHLQAAASFESQAAILRSKGRCRAAVGEALANIC